MGVELLWCHGVVDAGVPDDVPGIEGAPVRGIDAEGATVLVSPVDGARFEEAALREQLDDLDRLAVLAGAHEGVLTAALERGSSVVPFPLCTIHSGETALRERIAARRDELSAALRLVRDRAEWSVKALHSPPTPPEPVATPTSGAAYLACKKRLRVISCTAADVVAEAAARIHERLAEEAVSAVLERPQDPRLSGHGGSMVLNGAYLVARASEERFRGVLEDLAAEYEPDGLRLVLSGPWPAHHFTGGAAG